MIPQQVPAGITDISLSGTDVKRDRVRSTSTPIFKIREGGRVKYLREIDMYDAEQKYDRLFTGSTLANIGESEMLSAMLAMIEPLWTEFANFGIALPKYKVSINKLSNGKNGIFIIAEEVRVFKGRSVNDKKTKSESFKSLMGNLEKYYIDRGGKRLMYWADLTDKQFVYGVTDSDPVPKWYLFDLDPKFAPLNNDKEVAEMAVSIFDGLKKLEETYEKFL